MRVRELYQIKGLESFQLVAGEKGLERSFKDAVIFEYENFSVAPDNYYEGDFIISTLIFAKDHTELIVPTLQRLMKQGIAGLAIKYAFFEELPTEIIEYADKTGLSVFLFQDTYIENIIVSIHEYMRSKANLKRYEKDIKELLDDNLPGHLVNEKAALINPGHTEKLLCIYLRALSSSHKEVILSLINAISGRKNHRFIAPEYVFHQFREGVFVLINHGENEKEDPIRAFRTLLDRLQIAQSTIAMGISSSHEAGPQLDLCVKESYYACCYALYRKQSCILYSDLGIYRFIFPILMNKTGRSYYEDLIGQLEHHDQQNHTGLLITLNEYVNSNCDISTTAKQLYQHPNTIRYRLRKIYDLIGCANDGGSVPVLYILALIHDMKDFWLNETQFFDL